MLIRVFLVMSYYTYLKIYRNCEFIFARAPYGVTVHGYQFTVNSWIGIQTMTRHLNLQHGNRLYK